MTLHNYTYCEWFNKREEFLIFLMQLVQLLMNITLAYNRQRTDTRYILLNAVMMDEKFPCQKLVSPDSIHQATFIM